MELLNRLDLAVIEFCARFAGQSELFDRFYVGALAYPSFKFLPLIMIVWFLWFKENNKDKNHLCVLNCFLAGFLALILSRLVQNFSVERPRPLLNPDITVFVAPAGPERDIIADWSSFPSDHASMAFAISIAILLCHRRLGMFALFWSLMVISFPRVYSGYHYFSDILGGLAVGGVSLLIVLAFGKLNTRMLALIKNFEEYFPQYFYALVFFASYQFATMFNDFRWPITALFKHLLE